MDAETLKVLMSNRGKQSREIASLTKIMTCFITCELILQKRINPITVINVSQKGPQLIGTSAQLRAGDQIKLIDLLHALMLPSGNDAALEIALFVGKYLKENLYKESTKNHYQIFVQEMNRYAEHLMLQSTRYANPHGLADKWSRSCTTDQARLSAIAMNNNIFRSIVGLKIYQCTIKDIQNNERIQIYQNTNKLLVNPECLGIKTGKTSSAGPCLSSYFNINGKKLVIVVFQTAGSSERFDDCYEIFDFVCLKLGLKNIEKK